MRLDLHTLGAAAAAADLASPAGGRFRRSARLTLATDGAATGLQLAGPAPVRALFSAREADALAAGAVERATLSADGRGLMLKLPAARAVARILLASAQAGDQVAAYRFDGQAVSDDPVSAGVHGSGGAALDVVDRQLVLKRLRGGQALPLAPADVRSVFLRYEPTGIRVGFLLTADGASVDFPPAPAGAAGRDGLAIGLDLAAALAARIARLPAPLPNPIAIDLVLEADQPCRAAVTELALSYLLTRSAFPPGAPKQRLRFPGGRRATQSIALSVPSTGTIVSLPVTLTGLPAGTGAGASAPATAAGAAPSGLGIAFSGDDVAIAPVRLPQAAVATGVLVELAAPEEAEVSASLWDESATPRRQLAESRPVAIAGAPAATAFLFDAPVALPAGLATIGLRASRGTAVLALGPGAGEAAALETDGIAATPRAAAELPPRAALILASQAGAAPAEGSVELRLAGRPVAAPGLADPRVDLASALNALPVPRPATVTLEIATDRVTVVTVDPPVVLYDRG